MGRTKPEARLRTERDLRVTTVTSFSSCFWTRVKSESEQQFMEIPTAKDRGSESAAGLDFLFQFSPVLSSPEENNQNTGAVVNTRLPVRGDTKEDTNETFRNSSSKKKQKFFTEMKTVVKLEKSRQSARECRARKKLRYQYLDDLIIERERANERLRGELSKFNEWSKELDEGRIPEGLEEMLANHREEQRQKDQAKKNAAQG